MATAITKRTDLITVSLGSGAGCDAQYLFSADLLGEKTGRLPRHAKSYRDFATVRRQMQTDRIAAYREYRADIEGGTFPNATHTVRIDPEVLAEVLAAME